MQTSDQLNEIATALAKAQGEITGALKDSANPFFKSKYADLASCWDACREPLSKNGLSIVQSPEATSDGLIVTTLLMHSTGQWIRSVLRVMPKDDTPQAVGSALTYARRYSLTAMVGIAQVDDDGNAASGRQTNGHVQAYDAPHSPKGDLGKNIDAEQAQRAAIGMREILEADVQEDVKALHVADKHDILNRDPDLYVAAADRLLPKERKAWKEYLAEAKKRAALEPPRASGRAA